METTSNKLSNEEYETLIAKTFEGALVKEKTIVTGKVVSIENDLVTIDVGSKSEGRIPVSEFHRPGQKPEMNIGDSFDVFIENVDNSNGETILSREKAIKQQSWNKLQDSFDNNKVIIRVNIDPNKAPRIPASSGFLLSPYLKNEKLSLFLITPSVFNWSYIFKVASETGLSLSGTLILILFFLNWSIVLDEIKSTLIVLPISDISSRTMFFKR